MTPASGPRLLLRAQATKAAAGGGDGHRARSSRHRTQPPAQDAAPEPAAAAEMLCRMHLLPFATRLGTVRTLWPSAETIFSDLQQEMERVREFMSGFESLLSSQGGFGGDGAPGSVAAAAAAPGEGFSVCQDVKDFAPEQLSVKVVGRKVMLVGQKETQSADDKGAFSYKYEVLKREWDVPEDVDAEALSCSLSDGRLRITAPRRALPPAPERTVPIELAAPQPAPAVEDGAAGTAKA